MRNTSSKPKERLEVVDALRGFAVFAILMVHCMEHFMYFVFPDEKVNWLNILDSGVHDTIFTLFAGKAYAIFALLFGLTFFIQQNNQLKAGKDFGHRFLWRLILLIVFSEINAMVYPGGDVLMLFVVMGLILFLTRNWSTKYIFILAIIFLLQPYEWMNLLLGKSLYPQLNGELYQEIKNVAQYGTNSDFLLTNLWTGQKASLLWALENGRLFQTGGLFLMGVVLGRLSIFKETDKNKAVWRNALIISAVLFAPLLQLSKLYTGNYGGVILDMWQKLAFTVVLVSSFVLLYWNIINFKQFVKPLLCYGRMSLTNYLTQSYIGALIFMPIGFNMAPYLGSTASLFVGLCIFLIQVVFSNWWLGIYRFGPLEAIWHKWTWIRSGKQFSFKLNARKI